MEFFRKQIGALCFYGIFIYSLNAQVYEGFVLYTPQQFGEGGNPDTIRGGTTYMMTNDQDIIHTWSHTRGPASMPYLLQDSLMIYPYRVPYPTMENGGVGGGVQLVSWDGTILWDYIVSNETYQHHHDVEPMPNGNILMLAWERKTASEAYTFGRQTINNPLNQMWSEAIFEIEPIGSNSGNIVWEWHLWDHLIQDVDSSLMNYGIIAEHPELMNINSGDVGNPGGPGGAHADLMHFNAIDYNEHLDQIVVSSRTQCEIYIIDHSTTTPEAASHAGGASGKGGDFLYRWGNPQVYDMGNASDKILNHQHGANWIPIAYPGAGHILLFNNDHTDSSSAVLEIIAPVDEEGNYYIDTNQPFGPGSWEWIHTGDYHTQMQGGAFRLQNGNTFVSIAEFGYLFEVTLEGEMVWEYQYDGNDQIPRAQKYSLDYLNQINELTINIHYLQNWNLVGIPVIVENPDVENVFPESIDGTLYSFDGNYILENSLTQGMGYWLRFPAEGSIEITGLSIDEITVTLYSGWNLITGISFSIGVNNIDDPNNLIIPETVYGYDGGYSEIQIIEPGKGYWIRSAGTGDIILSD